MAVDVNNQSWIGNGIGIIEKYFHWTEEECVELAKTPFFRLILSVR